MDDIGIHVGGKTPIKVPILEDGDPVDISGAVTKKLTVKGPNGKTIVNTDAPFFTDGTDGYLKWPTAATDFDVAGTWEIQSYLKLGDWEDYTSTGTFEVYENL